MTVFDIVTCPPTPITHFAVVLAPCVDGSIANGDLGSTASFAFEVRGLVHVAINATTNAGYAISGGKAVRTSVHGQAFVLKRLLQSSDAVGDLVGFGMVSMEVLDFTL